MAEPAKIVQKSRTIWRLGDLFHREDGPALEYNSGRKCWYRHGKRHREDGPAIELSSGGKHWYLDGIQYTEEEWFKKIVKQWGKP